MSTLLILAAPSNHPATADFWQSLQLTLSNESELSVYLLHEGARSLADARLMDSRIRLFACPRATEKMPEAGSHRLTLGGPGLLAELIERASTIHTFSPA
ncbi:hypothetical protein EBX31_03460 [bacterium]|nr:hypothetical protein [bacterium]